MPETNNIEEYINTSPENVQGILRNITNLVREVVPGAKEMITYKMPTFDYNGNRLYFAANKKHIGFYAIYKPTDFEKELVTYRSTKDTIKFQIDKPIPYDLIRKLIQYKLMD